MRKEYNDRWSAPLVNPAVTHGEYLAQREREGKAEKWPGEHDGVSAMAGDDYPAKPANLFIPTIDGVEVSPA